MHLRIIWKLSEQLLTEHVNEENKQLASPGIQCVLLGTIQWLVNVTIRAICS